MQICLYIIQQQLRICNISYKERFELWASNETSKTSMAMASTPVKENSMPINQHSKRAK